MSANDIQIANIEKMIRSKIQRRIETKALNKSDDLTALELFNLMKADLEAYEYRDLLGCIFDTDDYEQAIVDFYNECY